MEHRKNVFLIIVDNLDNLIILTELIKESFYESEIMTAQSGEKGLHLARKHEPDVILLDNMMPDMDGYEVCRQLKADEVLREIPIIVMALKNDKETCYKALQSGADAFLNKPIDEMELFVQLNTMLKIRTSNLRNRVNQANQLGFQALISDIASNFVNISPDMIDNEISDSQRRICEFLKIDLSSIYLVDYPNKHLILKLLYTNAEIPFVPENFTAVKHFPWCEKQLISGKIVDVSSLNSLPADAMIDKESWEYYGIKSSLMFPLITKGNQIIGTISFDMLREEITWSTETANQLQLVARIFTNAFSRKHQDQLLKDSEERFQLMIENISNTVGIIDKNGIVQYRSPNTETLFGASPDDVIGKSSFDFVHPQDIDRLQKKLYKVLQGGDGFELTEIFRYIRKDGSELVLQLTGKNLVNNRLINGLLLTYKDITELKKRESSLKESEERYRIAQEMGRFGHWSFDPISQEFSASPETNNIYGFPMVGKTTLEEVKDCISKHDLDRVMNAFYSLIQDGKVFDEEFEIYPKNSSDAKYIWDIAELQKDAYSDRYIVSGIVQDITERKRLENDLVKYRNHLEDSNKMLENRLDQSINAISKIGELRDMYTAGHQKRVRELACAIAIEMGLPDDTILNISYGALIHDIGKIYIPSDILNKPGKITNLEYQILQNHADHSYDVVKEIDFPWQIPTMIYQHHERIDGTGYPQGLTGDQILLESRILMVADVVEAMSMHRPYRPALGIAAALEEITMFKGARYDNAVVEVCIKLFKDMNFSFSS